MVQHINIVKYREIPSNFCLNARFTLKILLIIKLLVIIFNFLGYSIYLFNIPQYLLTFLYDVVIIFVGIACFSFVKKYKYVLISILALFIMIIYGSNIAFYNETTVYNKFISPDNQSIIVTKSNGYLFSGKTKFYTQNGFILSNTNISIELDEGYQNIRNADVEVLWSDSLVTFNYVENESNSIILSKEIKL